MITPLPMGLITDPRFMVRFWRKVRRDRGCWPWLGYRNGAGYGQIEKMVNYRRHVMLAHRVAWALHNGQQVPDGLMVLHSCDNPSCCNPAHLRVGTHADNMRDMDDRKRRRVGNRCRERGHRHPAARFSAEVKAEAYRLITAEGLAYGDVALALGCGVHTVNRWAKEFGIRRRSAPALTVAVKQEIGETGRWSKWQPGWTMVNGKPTYTG